MKAQALTVDCQYLRPEFAAAFVRFTETGEIAIIENNTQHSVPLLLRALREHGASPEQVHAIIITHVHLDHAGGTAALLAACPHAQVLAHPRAARHLIDPSKLIAGAQAVYGPERFKQLYGEILPVPASRILEMADGANFQLGGTTLHFLHTRGHAKHHFVVHDPELNAVYTGDTFGLAYPALQGRGVFTFPSTSPTDFEPEEALASLDRILALGCRTAHLTHYGPIHDLPGAAAQLRAWIEKSAELVELFRGKGTAEALQPPIETELRRFMKERLERAQLPLDSETWALLKLDLEINAQGLAWVASREA